MARFYRDDHGHPRVEVEAGQESFAAFLEDDIQGSEYTYRRFRELVDTSSEDETEKTWTGNAHCVTVAENQVVIENLWDEELEPSVLSVVDFAKGLDEWYQFACRPRTP